MKNLTGEGAGDYYEVTDAGWKKSAMRRDIMNLLSYMRPEDAEVLRKDDLLWQ